MTVQIIQGDCRDVLRTLADESVHAVVTDPPYELGFMGKAWDSTGVAYNVDVWRECLRALKPGGHLLAFGGSRTYHRLACAVEDAGFEIRDQIMWLYGSGFPKSKNLDGDWQGWDTALKPAHEPIVVARKPLIGTVAANVQAHGTGALNIDASRIQGPKGECTRGAGGKNGMYSPIGAEGFIADDGRGRWPANAIHDGSEEVLAAFPDAPGQIADASQKVDAPKTQNVYGDMRRGRAGEPSANSDNNGAVGFAMKPGARRIDSGSAARFFYCAKASKADREAGCDGLPTKRGGMVSNTSGQHITRRDGGEPGPRLNHHPTVKPTELMRYLVRLVTPPGGTVLDPFAGSGSTGKAATAEGFDAILIEQDSEYIDIARARIVGDEPLFAAVTVQIFGDLVETA